MKTIKLPSRKHTIVNLRVLAKELYGRDMFIETIYTKGKPNTYMVEGGTGGRKAGDEAALLIRGLEMKYKSRGGIKIEAGW